MEKTNLIYIANALRHAREKGYDTSTIEFIHGYLAEYCTSECPAVDKATFDQWTQSTQ